MSGPVAITGWGYVDERGFGNARTAHAWAVSAPPPESLRWRTISKRPCSRFGRLDVMSRYALIAVELLDQCVPQGGLLKSDTAVVLATERGSLGVDYRFFQSTREPSGASPSLFSYTLPGMAIAEIAIRHGLTGLNLCLMTSFGDRSLGLWEAVSLIAGGEATCCLAVLCDAVPQSVVSELNQGMQAPFPHTNQAYAFLMEGGESVSARSGARFAEVHVVADSGANRKGASRDDMTALCDFLASRERGGQGTTIRAPASFPGIGTLLFTGEEKDRAAKSKQDGDSMDTLIEELKRQIIDAVELEDITPEDIDESEPLFVEGLGLDSIDALELAVMLEKHYGIRVTEKEVRSDAFGSVLALAAFIQEKRGK